MSRRIAFIRHGLIIQRLRKHESSFNELSSYLNEQSEIYSEDLNISKRTFDRDRNEIRSVYRIDIAYNGSSRQYFINQENGDSGSNFMMESFDMFSALNIVQSISEVVIFSERKSSGSQHLFELLGACKNKKYVQFTYDSFHEGALEIVAQSCALKEVDYRWYLIGFLESTSQTRIFGLDRVSDLTIGNKIHAPANVDLDKMFKNSFGIYDQSNQEAVDITLSFTPSQGKYVTHQPLHHTQKSLVDNEKEYRVSLRLAPSYDFLMKLRSYGDQVKVIEPKQLREELVDSLTKAVKQQE